MSLLSSIKSSFGLNSLYELFEISASASESEIKKAFYKLALKLHPDRVSAEEKESATLKFQLVSKAYEILANPEARAVYNETGEILGDEGETGGGEGFFSNKQEGFDWETYWRALFRKIGEEDIANFAATYRGSEEEAEHVKEAYLKFEGNMEEIIHHVMCSTVEDEPRFKELIGKLIRAKQVPSFKAFEQDNEQQKKKRQARASKEAKEAEELKKQLGLNGKGSENTLALMIAKRGEKRLQDLTSALEAKYGGGGNNASRQKGSKQTSKNNNNNNNNNHRNKSSKSKKQSKQSSEEEEEEDDDDVIDLDDENGEWEDEDEEEEFEEDEEEDDDKDEEEQVEAKSNKQEEKSTTHIKKKLRQDSSSSSTSSIVASTSTKTSKKKYQEPTEEEFQLIQQRLLAAKNKKK